MADPKPNSSLWFVEAQNQRLGPYTREQIKTLVETGSLPNTAVATTDRLGGTWISVQEVLQGHPVTPRATREETTYSSFRPPARPSQVHQQTPPQIIEEEDPTLPLLDALQAARERKNAKEEARQSSSSAVQWNPVHDKKPKKIYWIAGGVAVLIIGMAWAGLKFFSKPPEEAAGVADSKHKTSTPQDAPPSAEGHLMTAPTIKPPPRPAVTGRPGRPTIAPRPRALSRGQKREDDRHVEDDLPPEGEPQMAPQHGGGRPIDAPPIDDEPGIPDESQPMDMGNDPESPVVDEPADNY